MNVCVVAASYLPNVWSGVGRVTHTIAHGLAASGHKVDVLTYTGEERSKITMGGTMSICHISMAKFGKGINTALPNSLWPEWNGEVTKQLAKLKVDTVICVDSSAYPACAEFSRSQGARLVGICNFLHNVHGLLNPNKDPLVEEFMMRTEREFLGGCDVLLANNKVFGSKIKALAGRETEKLTMGVQFFEKENSTKARTLGEVVFVGKINREKGLERIIRVMPNLKWLKLKVIGPGENNYVHELVRKLNVQGRITFVGWKSSWEVNEAYNNASMCCVPSVVEPFGYNALDAMAAGIPVICSTANVLPELVSHAEDGMVFQNIDELQWAFEEMHHQVHLAKHFAENAKEKVKTQHTIKEMVASVAKHL